jgi:DNA invertase Pin-like site-specific DNA recombinase
MTLVGYARVSSIGQSLDVQLEKAKVKKRSFDKNSHERLQTFKSERLSLSRKEYKK